ncbi:unnamed protein product [Linum trigynum]|uniref:Uncharacterized protein n=1 Tax=Linum trigynum TaxID=586398 RepID=A0AAV2CEK3_9ROSI
MKRCVLTHTGNWVSCTAVPPWPCESGFSPFKQNFSHNSGGFGFLRKIAISRERKQRTRVSKCPRLIFNTIGGHLELGEVPINVQKQESILRSMNSVSDSAFAFFSME